MAIKGIEMDEREALHEVLVTAIMIAQAARHDPAKKAEEAAKAFKAGLAAFVASDKPSALGDDPISEGSHLDQSKIGGVSVPKSSS